MPRPAFKNGIRKESNGTYTVKVGSVMRRGAPSYNEAVRRRTELQKEAGVSKKRRSYTVDAWAERWLTVYCAKKAETTKRFYRERITKFRQDFGDRNLSDLTKDELLAWGYDNRSRMKAVGPMFSKAAEVEADGLKENPFRGLSLTRSKGRSKPRGGFLKPENVLRLTELATASYGDYGQVFAAMIDVTYWEGLRPGEAYALKLEDADFEEDILHIRRSYRSKTGELVEYTKMKDEDDPGRKVPLFPRAKEALRLLRRLRPDPDVPFAFYSQWGRQMNQQTTQRYWNTVRAAYGDNKLDFYDLRHGFGSRLASRGMSPYDIAVLMGHEDGGRLAMETYIHTPEKDAIERARKAELDVAV
jgi:integrase